MNTLRTRGPYQGVLQILLFNSRKYVATASGIVAAALVWPFLAPFGRTVLLLGVMPALFWTVSSLIVSHYVYDRSPLYDFRQIARVLTRPPHRWINVHSGWDETSGLLGATFPGSRGEVIDIFDERLMTESSIRQARRIEHKAIPATPGSHDALPFAAHSFDAAFSIFAAHELRSHEQRVGLFREIARVLRPSGELVLIEHLRDRRNFLAFGPGFLHFFSHRAWRNAARDAGLNLHTELAITPFVHVCVLTRSHDPLD